MTKISDTVKVIKSDYVLKKPNGLQKKNLPLTIKASDKLGENR